MATTQKTDLCIIGGGPAGYVAAIRAGQLGMKTILIEEENLGGVCLNWGCIPTKALLKSAEVVRTISHAKDFGIDIPKLDLSSLNMTDIVKHSRASSAQLSKGVEFLMKKNGVKVIYGTASFVSSASVEVLNGKNKEKVEAKNFLITTGAKVRVLPGFEPDGEKVLTYREAMCPTKTPKSIIVVGSGAIGMEFAHFYNTMGTKVTVLEVSKTILSTEDEEISALAKKQFSKDGIQIENEISLVSLKKDKKSVEVTYSKKNKEHKISGDKIIMAVGVVPNSEKLHLDKAKVKTEKLAIITNEYCETSQANIYAAGDVTQPPYLAHKASHEAILAVNNIHAKLQKKSQHSKPNKNHIPGCIYTYPQIASIGITEQEAKAQNLNVKIGRFNLTGNGKAVATNSTFGMTKTIFDAKTGELLGAHMIGKDVTEMIQGFCLAMKLEATEEDIMHTIFPHPTISETMHESVLDAFDQVIHS